MKFKWTVIKVFTVFTSERFVWICQFSHFVGIHWKLEVKFLHLSLLSRFDHFVSHLVMFISNQSFSVRLTRCFSVLILQGYFEESATHWHGIWIRKLKFTTCVKYSTGASLLALSNKKHYSTKIKVDGLRLSQKSQYDENLMEAFSSIFRRVARNQPAY